MKQIKLINSNNFAHVDDECYPALIKYRWREDQGYAVTNIKTERGEKKIIAMHRMILQTPEGVQTDHVDRNGLNNLRENLRCATHSQNKANSKIPSNNTSGYKGVSWDRQKNRWLAYIKVNGKQINLLRYKDPVDAAKAYNEAALKYFGEFANLNKI